MLKVAVVGTRGFPNIQGGVETHCEQLYTRLSALGCHVTVYARAPYLGTEIQTHHGVTLIPIDCPRNKHLEAIIHTAKAVLKASHDKPDILHIHGIGPSIMTPFARCLGMKVIVTHHGENYKHKKWGFIGRQILRMCEAIGVFSANKVITISHHIHNQVQAKFFRTTTVVPNGVPPAHFISSTETLQRFSLQKDKYILAVGRLVPEKGFHDLISSFIQLSLKDWRLVIVGKADHEGEYSSKIVELAKSSDNIVLTGTLLGTPLEELYTHAGIFILPSYYEGLPIALLEALSYGVRCIASEIPANKNVKVNSMIFFKVGDIGDLATKIEQAVKNSMGKDEKVAQIRTISMKYDWDEVVKATLNVYHDVLKTTSLF